MTAWSKNANMKKAKKKLYFILADENLFHPHYLSQVIKHLPQEYEVAGITFAKDVYKKGFSHFLKQQLNIWGIVGFLFIAGNSFYKSLRDKNNISDFSTIRSIARYYNLPVVESHNVNSEAHRNYLKNLGVDIIISSNGHIFRKELLSLPKIACINRHTGLLPKYGGVLPVFWAMYNNEKEFGVSVHYMVEQIDKGNILAQKAIPSDPKNSLFRNYLFAFEESIWVTLQALEHIEKKKIVALFKKNDKSYFSFPKPEIIADFKKNHHSFSLTDIVYFYNKKKWKYRDRIKK